MVAGGIESVRCWVDATGHFRGCRCSRRGRGGGLEEGVDAVVGVDDLDGHGQRVGEGDEVLMMNAVVSAEAGEGAGDGGASEFELDGFLEEPFKEGLALEVVGFGAEDGESLGVGGVVGHGGLPGEGSGEGHADEDGDEADDDAADEVGAGVEVFAMIDEFDALDAVG